MYFEENPLQFLYLLNKDLLRNQAGIQQTKNKMLGKKENHKQ